MGWSVIALRRIQVKKKDGTYVMIDPGGEISEALGFAEFPNPGLLIKRHIVRAKDDKSIPPYRGKYEPPRAVTAADLAAKEKRRAMLDAGIEPPKSDFEPAGSHNIGPGKDQPSAALDFGEESAEKPAASTEPEAPAGDESAAKVSEKELMRHSIGELKKLAKQLGVKPKKSDGKKEIVAALLAVQA